MTVLRHSDLVLAGVKVPAALVADPARFGGVRDADCLIGDLVVRDGRALRMQMTAGKQPDRDKGGLVLPALTEVHAHLDKCHTISRMSGVGGDLRAAIDAQARDRAQWTDDDIRARAGRGMQELAAAGCHAVRSHVDWGSGDNSAAPSRAWRVMRELAQDWRDRLELQVAPLTGVEDMADPATADTIAQEVAAGGGVLGVFVLDQPARSQGIDEAFRVAEAHGLALDFHVDEGLGPGLDGLELIADAALRTQFQGPVLCGHACSLMNLDTASLNRVADKLARAQIAVAGLPSTNLYLQGRTNGTPDRRGVTRISELRAAGVRVVIGTDNVRDAFCPLGRHDPLNSLSLAVLAAHLDPPFDTYLAMITTDARRALGLAPIHVDGAAIGDLVLFDAQSTSDLLAGAPAPRPLAAVLQGEKP